MRPSSLAVIGLGAIGGSLAWQARLSGVARVIGYSPSRAEGVEALKASAITEMADTPGRAIRGAELVVLAVPPRATIDLIGRLGPALEPGAVLTDVCSIKQPVMARAGEAGLAARFAGGHPLAGTHDSGFRAARPDRLRGCVVYVCELPGGDRPARAAMGFWRDVLEAEPILIDAAAHDRQLAWTSHLPQAVAYALAHALAERRLGGVSFGSGARDTTRLAASSPEMWLDILLLNRPALDEALERAGAALSELRALLSAGDPEGLERFLAAAREFRQGLDR
ncbi:MAG TPA: prephenate dehydrogenase [Gemmatimonadales bacterium]|nr:prephenate dehydrogenase [Gemmatimonadales bacterium]